MRTDFKQDAPPAQPTALNLRTQTRVLEISFDDGREFVLPFELLRVYSPSAEVKGHGPGQETLQTGKRLVTVTAVEPVGNYAIQPLFSDGHRTGIFSWSYLYWLGEHQATLWDDYLQHLQAAGHAGESGRDAAMPEAAGSACGHSH